MSDDYDYGELLVLQHDDEVGVSELARSLDGRAGRRPVRTVRPRDGDPLALDDAVAGVLVLGSFASVVDPPPWAVDEQTLIREAVEAGTPVFGICLGSQQLAAARGGAVRRRDRPEVGCLPLTRTEAATDDPVFAGWPDGASALFLHEDEPVLPEDGEPMLTGSDGVAAWRAAEHAYGVQFHPETGADQLRTWLDRTETVEVLGSAGVDPDRFEVDVERREPILLAAGLALVGRWLDAVVGRDDPTFPGR